MLFLWNSDKFLSPFYPCIFKSSHFPLLFFFFLFMVQLSNFFSRSKHALDFLSPSIMSNSIALLQEFDFLNIYHILLFPSPSLLSLSYIRFSLSNLGCTTASYLFFPSLVLPPLELLSLYYLRNIVQIKILPHKSPKVFPVAYRIKWFSSA